MSLTEYICSNDTFLNSTEKQSKEEKKKKKKKTISLAK